MRTYLIPAVLALAVVLAVSSPAAAQNILRGTVVDVAGKPVEGATVNIELNDSNRRFQTKTNKSGEFMQIGLASGRYNITVIKDTLKQTQPVTVARGRPIEMAFQLTPASGLTPDQLKANQEMQKLAGSALDAIRGGRDDEAIQLFNEIVIKVPTCRDCYYNLGQAYSHKQQYAEAEAAFKKTIELDPNAGDAYTGLANVYNSQKKYDLAQEASAKAAELIGPADGAGSAEAQYNQGVILWNAGKYPEAKVLFEAAVKADPNNAMAQYQLGMANLNLGQIPQAREAFEAYLKVDPNGPKAAEVKVFVQQLPQ